MASNKTVVTADHGNESADAGFDLAVGELEWNASEGKRTGNTLFTCWHATSCSASMYCC